ncbi:Basic helix-loop-helix transcription factor [Heracleum sosnowskyi]|uniref:Basic helix-loop-helix transcription factor n=1 Tax=Heracleum sosnowskyi TaxID=360622 RepID=A0AAD8MBG5_9APIA|nr:Basic helix-loop-helix transcription factor [Heracleum sosnowskyi]
MLTVSPPLFQTFGWSIEHPIINHDSNDFCAHTDIIPNPFLHLPSTFDEQPQVGLGSDSSAFEPNAVKKINHNANERDRRKKMNILYSSLRTLLPASDQAKKLSIPNTVSRVLKYIPELQNEVERLIRKKEELTSKISKRGELIQFESQRNNSTIPSCSSTVSASLLGDRDVTIQISTYEANMSLLSEAIEILEKEGFHFVNASFNSFGKRLFYNMHFQAQRPDQVLEIDMLRRKLSTLCEKREDQIHSTSISFKNI